MPERSGMGSQGEIAEEIAVWIAQTPHTAARLRVFAPDIAATLASLAEEVEERARYLQLKSKALV
jgi:hypothetical protein